MTQPQIDFDAPPSAHSFNAILADYLKRHANQWIDAAVIADIAGRFASRTRISECRRLYGMVIENKTERVKLPNGQRFTRSLYRLVQP